MFGFSLPTPENEMKVQILEAVRLNLAIHFKVPEGVSLKEIFRRFALVEVAEKARSGVFQSSSSGLLIEKVTSGFFSLPPKHKKAYLYHERYNRLQARFTEDRFSTSKLYCSIELEPGFFLTDEEKSLEFLEILMRAMAEQIPTGNFFVLPHQLASNGQVTHLTEMAARMESFLKLSGIEKYRDKERSDDPCGDRNVLEFISQIKEAGATISLQQSSIW